MATVRRHRGAGRRQRGQRHQRTLFRFGPAEDAGDREAGVRRSSRRFISQRRLIRLGGRMAAGAAVPVGRRFWRTQARVDTVIEGAVMMVVVVVIAEVQVRMMGRIVRVMVGVMMEVAIGEDRRIRMEFRAAGNTG